MMFGPDGHPMDVPARQMWLDACAWDGAMAIREAANLLHQYGYAATSAVLPWSTFHQMLDGHRPGHAGTASSFPHPGMFVQTGVGWVWVAADERLNKGKSGWVRDAYTGACVELRNMP